MKKIILLLFFFIFSERSIPISLIIPHKKMVNLITELLLNNLFSGPFCKEKERKIYKKYNITEKDFLYNYFFYTKKIENHINILRKVRENLLKRHRAESNRYKRFCRPLPFQSATVP